MLKCTRRPKHRVNDANEGPGICIKFKIENKIEKFLKHLVKYIVRLLDTFPNEWITCRTTHSQWVQLTLAH